MYLSRLELNISSPSVRQALSDAQDMHRNLMRAFGCARNEVNLLYRISETRSNIVVYVQSSALPDWSQIEKLGYVCTAQKDISLLCDKYRDGAILGFSLLASPSKKQKSEGKNSKRIALKTDAEKHEWINRKAKEYGFEILTCEISSESTIINGQKGSGIFRFSSSKFDGVLRIMNAETFWKSFNSGFGPEKAYGMGLMLLKKV